MSSDSQTKAILEHLKSGGSLTHLAAIRLFGCARLGARVYDLRRLGHPIETRMVTTGRRKRVAQHHYGVADAAK